MNTAKYVPLGGIAKVVEQVTSGMSTLKAIGTAVSVSREMVRSDLQAYLGKANYSRRMNERKEEARQRREPVILEFGKATARIADSALPQQTKADLLYWFSHAERDSKSCGLKLQLKLHFDRMPELLAENGAAVIFRTAQPTGTTPENKLGLHRFKVTASAEAKSVFVFGIRTAKNPVFYVFRGSEISSVQSLVLRYDKFHRKSKYSNFLSRWSVLKK